jgi:hypothetical protein
VNCSTFNFSFIDSKIRNFTAYLQLSEYKWEKRWNYAIKEIAELETEVYEL